MAGDWIKMRADLFTHPKVVRIASALKADTLRTVGGLMSVWCLFDAHSVDGHLDGYNAETLDSHLRWSGFFAAMSSVSWIAETSDGLVLPEFSTHNGQSAKRRAQDADRKKEVRNASASDADKKRTREEKRREEKSNRNTATAVATPAGVSDDLWADFKRLRATKKAPVTQTAIDGIAREAALAGVTLAGALTVCCERGWTGFKADWMYQKANGQPANKQTDLEARNRAVAEQWLRDQETLNAPH